MLNLSELQREHKEWLDKIYPNQPAWQPAAGMLEEAGELVHAVLKHSQTEMFGTDPRYTGRDWQEAMIDAVGDCALFACSLCNTIGRSFHDVVFAASGASYTDYSRQPIEHAVSVVSAAVDVVRHQSPSSVVVYLVRLMEFCKVSSIDFYGAVVTTWAEVKKRTRDAAAEDKVAQAAEAQETEGATALR